MPTYVYKFVDTGETIEVQQSFSDDTLTEAVHPDTGEMKPVKKVFQPVGVTFKGSGFFKTDNRGKQSATTAGPSNGSSGSGSGGSGSGKSGSSDSSGSGSSGSGSTTSGEKSTGSGGSSSSKAVSTAGSSD
jgi:predicted nucleic acid-binding Zn ribbon protein